MLTPNKINDLIKAVSAKHTQARYGLYPPQKKIMSYISRQIAHINKDASLDEIGKVQEMTNLLEGFIRYLNEMNKILQLDIKRILTYIYYPESEEKTLFNKDNLLIGSKGETVRLWHDAYYSTNRKQIINCLIACKNVLYDKGSHISEYMKTEDTAMPEQMQKRYEEMFVNNKIEPRI